MKQLKCNAVMGARASSGRSSEKPRMKQSIIRMYLAWPVCICICMYMCVCVSTCVYACMDAHMYVYMKILIDVAFEAPYQTYVVGYDHAYMCCHPCARQVDPYKNWSI
jgi:hypothetical protein